MAQHEIRVALVMNGGVSLAVWMAGVTHELDLIRRASTPGTPAAQPHDRAVAERWRDLLREERRLVVDVIAGTSAGGLNGAMLATAIAHDATLDPAARNADASASARRTQLEGAAGPEPIASGPWLREQWCRLGTLKYRRLLPDPDESPPRAIGSILDGDFFLDQVRGLLKELAGDAKASDTHPVTLFTTASGLGRQEFVARDAADQPFEVADHRFLYRFTTDLPRQYDPTTLQFSDAEQPGIEFDDIDRLALATRSSASFPVAFAPQSEQELLNCCPPRRRPTAARDEPSWLMDGGVLDNAPFGPVLETVARAPVTGHVSRYVLYVVPSSGIGRAATKLDQDGSAAPSWKTTAMSAIQFPREVDFRSDIEELEALRVEADTAWSDTQHAFERANEDDAERCRLLDAAKNLQQVYIRGRAAGAVWEAMTIAQAGRLTVLDTSAAAAAAEQVDQILSRHPLWTPWESESGTLVVTTGSDARPLWPWGLGPAERVARTLLRSMRTRTKTVVDEPGATDEVALADLEGRLERLSAVRADLRAIREVAEAKVAALGQPTRVADGREAAARIEASTAPVTVTDELNQVFAECRIQEALGLQIRELQRLPDGAKLVETALAVEVVSRCTSSRTPDQRSAPFAFVRLGPDVTLPILSEDDQLLAEGLGDRILYGTQVGHFGAFGPEEWRRWDWLMGRLHAVTHLGTLLYDTHSPDDEQKAAEWVKETQRAVLSAEGFDESDLTETLHELQRTFPDGVGMGGLAQMLQAMNEADADAELGTEQLGDRLVSVSGDLPGGLGRWVKAAAARTATRVQSKAGDDLSEPPKLADRFVRWFTEPVRHAVWNLLTQGRSQLEPTRGWLVIALNVIGWLMLAAVGAVLLGVAATMAADRAWLIAAIGSALLTFGVVLASVVWVLRRGRSALASGVRRRLVPRA
jgi:patatin-related protein